MRTGAIRDIIDYFFQHDGYVMDIERALKSFFAISSVDKLLETVPDFTDVDSHSHRLFHEWFVFDFKLSSGRTPLQEWYEANPGRLSQIDLTMYKDLLDENEYGYFEVLSSNPGRVEVESLATKRRYIVKEYKAASFLLPKLIIITRVGLVNGRYEFVSGFVDSTDAEFGPGAQKVFGRYSKTTNPREIYNLYHKPRHRPSSNTRVEDSELFGVAKTIPEARVRLRAALKTCDILAFVSVDKIIKWIRTTQTKEFQPIAMLMGLASDEASEADTIELTQAVVELNNAIRNEENQSNNNQVQQQLTDQPRFFHNFIDPFTWYPVYFRGVEQMKEGELAKALNSFNETFRLLLEQRTTTREVFRLFANKGIAMLALGDIHGRYFLELALKINPNYDFARKEILRHDRELLSIKVKRDRFYGVLAKALVGIVFQGRTVPEALANDPASKYYQWFKLWRISFSKHAIKPAKIIPIKMRPKKNHKHTRTG